jgi:hypothetical protein
MLTAKTSPEEEFGDEISIRDGDETIFDDASKSQFRSKEFPVNIEWIASESTTSQRKQVCPGQQLDETL